MITFLYRVNHPVMVHELPIPLRNMLDPGPKIFLNGNISEGRKVGEISFIDLSTLTEALNCSWKAASGGVYVPEKNIYVECQQVGNKEDLSRVDGRAGLLYAGERRECWVPLRWAVDAFELEMISDPDNNQIFLAIPLRTEDIPAGVNVPVLVYHGISDEILTWDYLFVRPKDFREQIEYLLNKGYQPIFFSDLLHIEDYEKPILLTFDDGYASNYENLYPILKEFGVKATFSIIIGILDTPGYLTSAQVKEMSDSGLVDVQSHTLTHPYLSKMSENEQRVELEQSRLEVARLTGKIPYVICYPCGDYNDTTISLSRKYYSIGITTEIRMYSTDKDDPLLIPRIIVMRDYGLERFKKTLMGY